MSNAKITRRGMLRGAVSLGGAGVAAGALPGIASLASAQAGSGYKALVCVYLVGGLDNFDTVVPTDPEEYDRWADARAPLLDGYARRGDDSRTRDALLSIGAQADGRRFGLPRQMAPLHAHYGNGRMSVFANVGPLAAPSDRPAIEAGRVALPPRLMSHNDQRSLWQTSAVEGATTGWGGRMMDAAQEASPFAAISLAGAATFLAGTGTEPLAVSEDGFRKLHGTSHQWAYGSQEVPALLKEHYAASAASVNNLFASDLQARRRRTVEAIDTLADLAEGSTIGDEVREADNSLANQLAMVAKLIGMREALGVKRQVFFVRAVSFDTHRDQAGKLPGLQTQLARALDRFYRHTVAQGIAQDVTTFTASEFGRTLSPNSSGTDHGWGGHHFVLGGSVTGGRILGEVPPAGFGHDRDFDQGRLIPSFSTEQYAASLGRWFGLGSGALRDALPNVDQFEEPPLVAAI